MTVKFQKTSQGMKQVSPTDPHWTPGAEHQGAVEGATGNGPTEQQPEAQMRPEPAQTEGDQKPSEERKKILGIF